MIGPCNYLTCDSVIGSSFRATLYRQEGGSQFCEVLLCPTHERFCRSIRDRDGWHHLMITPEGWVYLRFWMDAMGFV